MLWVGCCSSDLLSLCLRCVRVPFGGEFLTRFSLCFWRCFFAMLLPLFVSGFLRRFRGSFSALFSARFSGKFFAWFRAVFAAFRRRLPTDFFCVFSKQVLLACRPVFPQPQRALFLPCFEATFVDRFLVQLLTIFQVIFCDGSAAPFKWTAA